MDAGGGPSDGEPDAAMDPRPDAGLPGNKGRPKVQSVAPPYTVVDEVYKYEPKSDQSQAPEWKVRQGPPGMTSEGRQIAWTPTKEQAGTHRVTVEGKSDDVVVEQEYSVTVGVADTQAVGAASGKDGGNATVTSPKSRITGASITVKPGAIDKSYERDGAVALSISELSVAPPQANTSGATKAVQFGPRGLVFNQPALVALPLADDIILDLARVGAFVYNAAGVWERVPVVSTDLANRLVFAQASHFSIYSGSQGKVDLRVSVDRMPASSSCDGRIVARPVVTSPLSDVDASAVNSPSAAVSALIEGGAGNLEQLLTDPNFKGSLRFVRVVKLLDAGGSELEERVTVTTLFAPGDGSAVVHHTRPSGDLLGEFEFASLGDEIADIAPHLRGEATHMFFQVDPLDAVSVSARWHIVYFEDDVTSDATDVETLGLAAVDLAGGKPAIVTATRERFDDDCDRLANRFDDANDRLVAQLVSDPEKVVDAFVGETVALSAEVKNSASARVLNWTVARGLGKLTDVPEKPNLRLFSSDSPGQHVVTVIDAADPNLRAEFVIAVEAPPLVNTKATCKPTTETLTVKVGEAVGLKAIVQDAESAGAAVARFDVQWGLVSEESGPLSLLEDSQLTAMDADALLVALTGGTKKVSCRADPF